MLNVEWSGLPISNCQLPIGTSRNSAGGKRALTWLSVALFGFPGGGAFS